MDRKRALTFAMRGKPKEVCARSLGVCDARESDPTYRSVRPRNVPRSSGTEMSCSWNLKGGLFVFGGQIVQVRPSITAQVPAMAGKEVGSVHRVLRLVPSFYECF